MITAFFLASPFKDCHNFILLKKQCMSQHSKNIPLARALAKTGRWFLIPNHGELGCAVIITVDVTVV